MLNFRFIMAAALVSGRESTFYYKEIEKKNSFICIHPLPRWACFTVLVLLEISFLWATVGI